MHIIILCKTTMDNVINKFTVHVHVYVNYNIRKKMSLP